MKGSRFKNCVCARLTRLNGDLHYTYTPNEKYKKPHKGFDRKEVIGLDLEHQQVANVAHEPFQVLAVFLYRGWREPAFNFHVANETG
jgi:hypothetical protein